MELLKKSIIALSIIGISTLATAKETKTELGENYIREIQREHFNIKTQLTKAEVNDVVKALKINLIVEVENKDLKDKSEEKKLSFPKRDLKELLDYTVEDYLRNYISDLSRKVSEDKTFNDDLKKSIISDQLFVNSEKYVEAWSTIYKRIIKEQVDLMVLNENNITSYSIPLDYVVVDGRLLGGFTFNGSNERLIKDDGYNNGLAHFRQKHYSLKELVNGSVLLNYEIDTLRKKEKVNGLDVNHCHFKDTVSDLGISPKGGLRKMKSLDFIKTYGNSIYKSSNNFLIDCVDKYTSDMETSIHFSNLTREKKELKIMALDSLKKKVKSEILLRKAPSRIVFKESLILGSSNPNFAYCEKELALRQNEDFTMSHTYKINCDKKDFDRDINTEV